ncbi:hypothetical protein [uncultured Sphingobium sp.]|uniref:hypothetical protein n=1 Tax=uncultured Sphingobium sp. TaxID=316087 RepID=UPI00259BC75A|nr:hypothetical protein [uncultured Sphingobium sp.]
MTEATDAIVHAMQTSPAPEGGWTMPTLRHMVHLSVGSFAAAVMQLRREGKMHPYELSLSRAMWPVDAVPDEAPAPTLAQEVAAEVEQTMARRDAARTYSHSGYVGSAPSAGAQVQEKALDGAPQLAASILRDRWGPTWKRLCRHAQETGQKPVTAMIALLDKGLDAETAA